MPPQSDSWQPVFLAGAAALILLQTWRGWRMGLVRQVVQLLALAAAYVAAWFGGPELAPMLQPLGMPDAVLIGLAGSVIGLVVFSGISLVSAILFKKTSDQSVGIVRLGYGASGAFVGMLFGVFLVWAFVLAIRVLGTLAETELDSARHLRSSHARGLAGTPPAEPSAFVRGVAEMKRSLEHGAAGAVVQQVDPLPAVVYQTIQKIGAMVANQQSLERFMNYPGVRPLAEHPRIRALQQDPEIAKGVMAHDIFALLRNQNIVQAANDAEITRLVRQLEFEKALDYALAKTEKPLGAPPGR